jgi:hypothetical protein
MVDRSNDPGLPSLEHAALSAPWVMIRAILADAAIRTPKKTPHRGMRRSSCEGFAFLRALNLRG